MTGSRWTGAVASLEPRSRQQWCPIPFFHNETHISATPAGRSLSSFRRADELEDGGLLPLHLRGDGAHAQQVFLLSLAAITGSQGPRSLFHGPTFQLHRPTASIRRKGFASGGSPISVRGPGALWRNTRTAIRIRPRLTLHLSIPTGSAVGQMSDDAAGPPP